MQTESNSKALVVLRDRIKRYGPGTLWSGAWATAAANFVGSFPWYVTPHVFSPVSYVCSWRKSCLIRFATYNYLSLHLPNPSEFHHSHFGFTMLKLSRQALIGFVSSVVSDTISNSLRVIKTYRQTAEEDVGYREFSLFESTCNERELIRREGIQQVKQREKSSRKMVSRGCLVEG